MIYDGLAIIDDAHEELSKLCLDKSLQNHLKIKTSEQCISNMLKKVLYKDQTEGQIAQSSSQYSKMTHLENFPTIKDLKEQYVKKEELQGSIVNLRPKYDKSGQSVPTVKISLGSDYAYDYKRIGKIAYGIRPSQVIIPDHLRLYLKINFIPRADPKLIKDMFDYGFLNLVYVSDDCREIKELPEKNYRGCQ